MIRFCCLFSALLLLAGCETAADRTLRKSPDFKAGYSDGCVSASDQGANPRASGLVRDNAAFAGNKAYHAGWSSGFGACRATTDLRPQSRGPIPDPGVRPF